MPKKGKVYSVRSDNFVVFNQLAVKVITDSISKKDYFSWLDQMIKSIGKLVHGAKIVEKKHARITPTLNTAVYYDTKDYKILPTGALLRTSCNKITHAFCAFKMAQDKCCVRCDHRHVFSGKDKRIIQRAPTSKEAVAIVKRLVSSCDVENPAFYLEKYYGISGKYLEPSLVLDDLRHTFYVWLDGEDALRCSLDYATVANLRLPENERQQKKFNEVEFAVYPRIKTNVNNDQRIVEAIDVLSKSLCESFSIPITMDIKYQRASKVLGISSK